MSRSFQEVIVRKGLFFLSLFFLHASLVAAQGPKIVFNMQSAPFPDIPFPNDLLTRQDSSSPTGLRLNIPWRGETSFAKRMREKLQTLDGFSTYGAIQVSFDKSLNIERLKRAQSYKGGRVHPAKGDAIFLINIDSDSKHFGEAVPLDVGAGNFPITREETPLFINDTRASSSNLLFETEDEEKLGKDTNFDGRIFRPNLIPRNGDPYKDLVTFYDLNTNTLILRVVVPLEERSKYLVILTKRVVGRDGQPVSSPFATPYHPAQKEAIEPWLQSEVLKKWGIEKSDIAFAWIFSTQSVTADLVALREGLYGFGPFSSLKKAFPRPGDWSLFPLKDRGRHLFLLPGARFGRFLKVIAPLLGLPRGPTVDRVVQDFASVDYLVMGEYETPYFLTTTKDHALYSEEIFHLDPVRGEYKVRREKVPFLLCVPKASPQHRPPFPLVFVAHGYTMNRLMAIPFCALFAKEGMAVLGIDAVGHGANALKTEMEKFLKKGEASNIVRSAGLMPLLQALAQGRARDLDGDGVPDSGGDFFTAYVFHTRDNLRQTIVDYIQATRLLRSFDGKRKWTLGGREGLAGDFNGDGVVDVGGPNQYFAAYGISLGGILTSILPAVEPAVKVAVPTVGGGGLADIAVRTLQGGVPQGVTLRLMGPLLVNIKADDGRDWLAFHITDVNRDRVVKVAPLREVKEGDKIVLENVSKGEKRAVFAGRGGRFRISIPTDVGDRLKLSIFSGDRSPLKQAVEAFEVEASYQNQHFAAGDPLVSPVEGLGLLRNTPEFRQYVLFAQTVLDPADPINYAPHYFLDPLDIRPEGKVQHNILLMPSAGDMNVPINTELSTARAAGLLPFQESEAEKPFFHYGLAKPWNKSRSYAEWLKSKMSWGEMEKALQARGIRSKTPNQLLIDFYVYEGLEKLKRFSEKPLGKKKCESDADCRFHGSCKKDGLCAVPILADVDDLAEGKTGFHNPRITPPLRLIRKTRVGVSALRIIYGHPAGSHFFNPFQPPEYFGVKGTFDLMTPLIHQVGTYLKKEGRMLFDDPCLVTGRCKRFYGLRWLWHSPNA